MRSLIKFLSGHPCLNISALEKRAGMPPRTIHQALAGTKGLPEKWAWGICKTLCSPGSLTIGVNSFTYMEETDVFIVEIQTGEPPEIKEVRNTIVHYVPVFRTVISDNEKLLKWLND